MDGVSSVTGQVSRYNVTPDTSAYGTLPGTRIIGLGNTLRGDDGVGVRVIQELAAQSLPKNIEVVDGGIHGLGLVNLLEGQQRVILVDAADIGKSPGQFVRFALHEVHLIGDDQHLSVHTAGLRDALLLAQALKMLPPEVIIFGVQPNQLEWNDVLSPEVEATLPELIAAILREASVSS